MNTSHAKTPRAVLWDFGGVILSSPFEAFNRYETETGLPKDFIRGLNARNGNTNAWAQMERNEVTLDAFVQLFEAEALLHGQKVDGWRILKSLSGDIRPQIYRHTCDLLGVAPEECIYLDDLGINLKPARALGMRTIKVGDPDVAIDELQAMVGIPLRG